ncbi:MAG: sigma 54-interacting transcriptional regulator [Myxococcota bacterium]
MATEGAPARPTEAVAEDTSQEGEAELAGGIRVGVRLDVPRGADGGVGITALARAAVDGAAGAVAAAVSEGPKAQVTLREGRLGETGIIGSSAPMRDLYRMLERIRGSAATVLITGENGTGKELVAKSIHAMSQRADQRFVATNCSAFNDNLLESELFGHRRGSFTGAVNDKPGLFRVADEGTFFLDEVGDMSPALQVKLLRVLQEGVFLPVGDTQTRRVDVRIIAATNRDLQTMVREGSFREDLYYRLHVVHLKVPPLRERKDDIPLLVAFFMDRLAKREGVTKTLAQSAMDRLMQHRWPGNVRELENEIERVWVLSGTETLIGPEHLSPAVAGGGSPRRPSRLPAEPASEVELPEGATLPEAIESLERRMIRAGLEQAHGNKTRAAEALGISRRNLIRKVQAYELDDVGRRR